MMRNNIYHIAEVELKKYLPKETEKNKIVCIDLKRIKNWKEYSIIVENALEFPRPVEGSPNRFLDWMRDLTWYDYDRYDILAGDPCSAPMLPGDYILHISDPRQFFPG